MSKTTTLGLVKPTHGLNVVEGENPVGVPNEAANLDAIDAAIAALQGAPQGTFLVTAPATDQTILNSHKLINAGGFQGPLTGDVTGNIQESVNDYAASGAITQKQGSVTISKSSALAAMTLADPTNVTDDGKILRVISKTAKAHTVTVATTLLSGTNNTITLGGAIGDLVQLEAVAGKWCLLPSINATASHV